MVKLSCNIIEPLFHGNGFYGLLKPLENRGIKISIKQKLYNLDCDKVTICII